MNEPIADSPFASSTIAELGKLLPIGIQAGNPPVLEKNFSFRRYRSKEEGEIAKLRKGTTHAGKVVHLVLAHMLTEWGGDANFSQKSAKVRESAIRNAPACDVLYAYTVLRIEALGPILSVKEMECPHCQKKWPWQASIEGLEVDFVEKLDDCPEVVYRLKDPIKVGERLFDEVVLSVPKWSAIMDVRPGGADVKTQMVKSSIRGARSNSDEKAGSIVPGNYFLDELGKYDLERIVSLLDSAFPSVDLSLEVDCPDCERTFTHAVQWNMDFFFSSSSLPPT